MKLETFVSIGALKELQQLTHICHHVVQGWVSDVLIKFSASIESVENDQLPDHEDDARKIKDDEKGDDS